MTLTLTLWLSQRDHHRSHIVDSNCDSVEFSSIRQFCNLSGNRTRNVRAIVSVVILLLLFSVVVVIVVVVVVTAVVVVGLTGMHVGGTSSQVLC